MTAPKPETITEDERPITLDEACLVFRGSLTPATLRAEHERGRLAIFKIGRRYYTTHANVKEMVRLCQEKARGHGSPSTRSAERGPSETERAQSARAALNETVRKLKKGLPIT